MNRKSPVIAILIVLFSLLLPAAVLASGTGEQRAGNVPGNLVMAGRGLIQIVDVLGMFPYAVDSVSAVGVTDQGMGDFYLVLDPRAGEKVRLGKSPGPEELAAADPDLVLLRPYLADDIGTPLERLGIPVLYLNLETPEDFDNDVLTVGNTLGQEKRAREINRWFDSRRSFIEKGVAASSEEAPRALILQVSGDPVQPTISVAPAGWIQSTQLELAGAVPLGLEGEVQPGWSAVGFEQIAAWNPDYIFLVSYRSDAAAYRAGLEADPLWQELDAVKNGRLLGAPADFYAWLQSDTRWILGAEWLARVMHPSGFGGSMMDSVKEFFRVLYGIEGTDFDQEIAPRLSGDMLDR